MSSSPNIVVLTRVQEIDIGTSSSGYFTWTGIRLVQYQEKDVWEHIEIPTGDTMVHQHIHNPHISGEIQCYDLQSLYTALYQTIIDSNGHTAIIPNTGRKWNVGYLQIQVQTDTGITTYICSNFKVSVANLSPIIVEREAVYSVKWTADVVAINVA
jgi:hypothetical protein